jgi:hypothetical protein
LTVLNIKKLKHKNPERVETNKRNFSPFCSLIDGKPYRIVKEANLEEKERTFNVRIVRI